MTTSIQSAPASSAADLRLQVYEIYLSVQGESTWSGLPCTFIRLTGCPLRCAWCDTEYAFYGGSRMTVEQVVEQVRKLQCPLVEITGGEPLAQPNCIALMKELLADGRTVLLETSGAYPISGVPPEVRKIVDLKCPDSGEEQRNLFENFDHLASHDEVKCVLASRADYEYAREIIAKHRLTQRAGAVLFSCVFGRLEPALLVEWMLADGLFDVRMQLQAHKFIWPPEMRGV